MNESHTSVVNGNLHGLVVCTVVCIKQNSIFFLLSYLGDDTVYISSSHYYREQQSPFGQAK